MPNNHILRHIGSGEYHTTTTVLRPFFWDHPGQPVSEENFCTLWCKGSLTEADMQTIRLCATNQCPPPPHPSSIGSDE